MSEMQTLLEEMVERLLADHVDAALVDAAEAGTWPDALWRVVEDQGLTRPLVPEEAGGLGAKWHDAFFIVRAAGRHGAPLPLPETIAASWLLAKAGLGVPAAPLALAEAPSEERLELHKSAGGWRLTGTARRVPWGRVADSLVVVVEHGGQELIVRAPLHGCAVAEGVNLAGEYRDTVLLENHPVEASAWGGGAWRDVMPALGTMLRSAQMAGALSNAAALSVTYANDRQQFGRALGKFQIIQQNLAVLASEAAAADVAAEAAFIAADQGDAGFMAAAAKVRACMAASQAIAIAHQVHGAIGFTREYALQRGTRRLMAWRTEFGGEHRWASALGRHVVDIGGEGFWPAVTAH